MEEENRTALSFSRLRLSTKLLSPLFVGALRHGFPSNQKPARTSSLVTLPQICT